MRDVSYRVALGGIVSALCILTMFLAGVMPALYLLLPMIAGVLLMLIAVEVNKGWAFLTYLAVSLLSLFVTFDKEAALIFIMFFGHYPIIRMDIQKLKPKIIRLIVKFGMFNACVLAYFYATVYLFGMDEMLDEFNELGKYGGYIMLAVSNFVFMIYDLDLGAVYKIYSEKFMNVFKNKK